MYSKMLIISTLVLLLCASYAAAQTPPPPDTLKMDYFAYANTAGVPDGSLRLTNPGTSGGNVCAALYVIDSYQEISECCSCFLSPNGLRTLSVNTDLAGNPLNGVIHTGTVSIVSTTTVNNTCPLPISITPTAGGVRAWATHIDKTSSSFRLLGQTVNFNGYQGSAADSQDATLSSTEQIQLQNQCNAVLIYGSGRGVCTCGYGD